MAACSAFYLCTKIAHSTPKRCVVKNLPNHTFYLSQTPQTCLCKNFLSGVNFSRLSEKNAYIFDFFRDIFSVFGAFSRFFGCKIWFSKILSAEMWLVTGWPTSIKDSQSTLFWKHVQHRYWVNTQYMQQTTHLIFKDLVDPGIWVEFASDDGNGTGGPGPLLLKDPGYAGSHLLYNLVLV